RALSTSPDSRRSSDDRMVEDAVAPPTGRLALGVASFALGWVVTLVTVSRAWLPPSLAGIVLLVGPKLGVLAAIAILCKPGVRYLTRVIVGYLKPPAQVSAARHRVGMAMFVGAILLGSLEPYLGVFKVDDGSRSVRLALVGDLLLLAGIVVLGGDF